MNTTFEKALIKINNFDPRYKIVFDSLIEKENNQVKFLQILHNEYIYRGNFAFLSNGEILDIAVNSGFDVSDNKIDFFKTLKAIESDYNFLEVYKNKQSFIYFKSRMNSIKNAKGNFWSGKVDSKSIDEVLYYAEINERVRLFCLRYYYFIHIFLFQLELKADANFIKGLIEKEYKYKTSINFKIDILPVMYNLFQEAKSLSLTDSEFQGY